MNILGIWENEQRQLFICLSRHKFEIKLEQGEMAGITKELVQMIVKNVGIVQKLNMVVCILCNYRIDGNFTSRLRQHIKTKKHQDNVRIHNSLINHDGFVDYRDFNKSLTKALIQSGIPLNVVNKKPFRDFFKNCLGKILPKANNLRDNYLPKIYQDTIGAIRNKIFGHKVFIQIDETRDTRR